MRGIPDLTAGILEREGWTDEQWAAHDARIQAERRAEAERERQREHAATRRRAAAWGVPAKDIECAVGDGLRRLPAVDALSAMTPDRAVVVLSGPPGCGKTTAAAAWLVTGADPESWGRLADPMFLHAAQLARRPRYDNEAMERLERARRLVLDDLGVEYADAKGAFTSLLDELVNARYANRLPVVITTNLRADAFAERYGERVIDRIRESGSFVALRGEGLRSCLS